MTIPKIVITNKIRLKKSLLPAKAIKKRYDRFVYNESKCAKCDNLSLRHNEVCDNCPAFVGHYRFFSKIEAAKGIWALPLGDIAAVKRAMKKQHGEYEVVDKRPRIPFKHKIKFTGKLYGKGDKRPDGSDAPDQVTVVKEWLKAGTGVIKAPPRSGKTVMSAAISVKLGNKTLILANQKEILKQFYETYTGYETPEFRGNKRISEYKPAKKRRAVTNIPELQRKTGKEIIRYVDKFSQLVKAKEYYDIILMTYQTFLRDPERIQKIINGRYSTLIVDEQHQGSAEGYLKILAQMEIANMCSLSATPDRKDKRSVFGKLILGPVVAESFVPALIPHIELTPTAFDCDLKTWNGNITRMMYNKERNKFIVDKVFEDLRDGHKVIIVPADRIEHIKGLVKMINKRAQRYHDKKGEDWPIELARAYHGKATDRGEIIEWVDSEKWDVPNPKVSKQERGPAPRVLVAMRKMIKEAIDFARPTCLHSIIPVSASAEEGSPLFWQMSNRVCTVVKNKRTPLVRVYVDQQKFFKSCAIGLFWNEIYPKSNLSRKTKIPLYHIPPNKYGLFKTLLEKKKAPPIKSSNFAWMV